MIGWLYRALWQVRRRPRLGLLFASSLVTIAVVGNAFCYWWFDGAQDPELDLFDALWYSIISITTIGYGDYSARTAGARVGTVIFVVLFGLSSFTVCIGMLVDRLTELALKGRKGMSKVFARDHVLIVHFPGAARVLQVVEEIHSDPAGKGRDIVVISDQIEELPFARSHVHFVRGSPLDTATLERAGVHDARYALILARSYDDENSDALVASAASVLDRAHPDLHIVAECLREEHRILFESVRCDAVVPVLRIGSNLLVQEVNDPGVTQLIDVVTSNLHGPTLFSTRVPREGARGSYHEFAISLLDRDIHLLAIQRGGESCTRFRSIAPEPGDIMVYIGEERLPWERFEELLR